MSNELDPAFEEDIFDLLLTEAPSENGTGAGAGTGGAAKSGASGATSNPSESGSGSGSAGAELDKPDHHQIAREAKRARNSGDLIKQADAAPAHLRDPNAPYDVMHTNKKNIAEGLWHAKSGVVELMTMRGNFWKVMGYTTKVERKQCLNPEEALLLVEKSQLLVRPSTARSGKHIPTQHFYHEALHFIPQAAVLTYNKLKSLDYITLRHNQYLGPISGKKEEAVVAAAEGEAVEPHSLNDKVFSCDADIYEQMRAHPNWSLLDTLVSFDVYPQSAAWTKKTHVHPDGPAASDADKKPRGYVVVQTGAWTVNSRLTMHLLRAAHGVPLIFAAVLPSGNLALEEFTDAESSLNWENEHAIDISYLSKVTMDTVVKRDPEAVAKAAARAAAKAKGKGKAEAEVDGNDDADMELESVGDEDEDEEEDEEEEEEDEEEEDL